MLLGSDITFPFYIACFVFPSYHYYDDMYYYDDCYLYGGAYCGDYGKGGKKSKKYGKKDSKKGKKDGKKGKGKGNGYYYDE